VTARNPATGEVLKRFECASIDYVYQAVTAARAAQPAWFESGIENRLNVMQRFQQVLHAKKEEEVAALISQETGKPQVEALVTEVIVVLERGRVPVARSG